MKCCTNCAHGTWLNSDEPVTEICTGCEYICGEPSMWKKQNMTNADRIRAMTDEELAHELALIASWDREQYKKAKSIGIEKVMMDWLQQPCKGE